MGRDLIFYGSKWDETSYFETIPSEARDQVLSGRDGDLLADGVARQHVLQHVRRSAYLIQQELT